MKTMKRKGFTLVELLVVIAILAILAGVGVAGYTAFIERAHLSNDNSIASQLNSMINYIKADSDGKYYNADIKEDNAWAFTQDVIEMAGLDGLDAETDGYNFYFDTANDEFVVVKDTDVYNYGMKAFISAFAAGESKIPGMFNNYFFADTKGSKLADAIRGFYTFDMEADKTHEHYYEELMEKWEEFKQSVSDAKEESGVDYTDIITNQGVQVDTYILIDNTTTPENPVIQDGVTDFTGIKVDSEGKQTHPSTDAPTFTVTENKTINISGEFNIPAGAFNVEVAADVTLTLNITVENSETLKKLVDAEFANVNVVIVINGVEYKHSEEEAKLVPDEEKNPEAEAIELAYRNPMDSFDIAFSGDAKDDQVNGSYIAHDKGTFNLELANIKGINANDPVISSAEVTWSIPSEYADYVAIIEEDGVVKGFKLTKAASDYAAIGNVIKVTATARIAKNGFADGTERASQTFEINVASISAGSVKVFDKVVAAGSTTDVTLVKTPDKDTYTIAVDGELTYVNNNGVKFNEDITWTYEGTGVEGTSGTGTIKLTGKGAGVLTVKVGTYLTYTLNLTIEDTANFALQPKNKNNFTILGNGNKVLLSDLFELKGDIPADAQLVVFNGSVQSGDSYMTPKRGKLTDQLNTTVDNNTQDVTNANYATLALQFTGEDLNNSIRIAVIHNGVRISEDITVKVANATNVRTWDDLSTNIANNVVFMNDIAMPSGNTATLDVATHTLYGNGFLFDVKTGKRDGTAGIITLKTGGVIRDVRIIGSVYEKFAVSVGDEYGTSVVDAKGGSIINSYIANCRSPLRIEGEEVIVKDTVFFGGRYANIDMVGGKLTIQGTVATVSQYYQNVIGTGIAAWFNNTEKIVNLTDGAEFKQYNFIKNDTTIKNSMPEVNFYEIVKIKTSDLFTQLFKSDYAQYQFKDSNNTLYINAGIAALDKYRDANQTTDTLTITGFEDNVYSGSVVYKYDIPLYTLIKGKLAEKGINNGILQMDARTYLNSNSNNAKLFEEYLELGGYYYPENYEFNGGYVQFKTFPAAE